MLSVLFWRDEGDGNTLDASGRDEEWSDPVFGLSESLRADWNLDGPKACVAGKGESSASESDSISQAGLPPNLEGAKV